MATKNGKKKSNKSARTAATEKRGRRFDYKDVASEFLVNGHAAVAKLIESDTVSQQMLLNAIDHLNALGAEKVDQLSQYIRESAGRGRTPPAEGEERTYSIQQVGEGEPFIRLPIPGGKKTGDVNVKFGAKSAEAAW